MKNLQAIMNKNFIAYHTTPETIAFYRKRELVLSTPLPLASLYERFCATIRNTIARMSPVRHYYDLDIQRRLESAI